MLYSSEFLWISFWVICLFVLIAIIWLIVALAKQQKKEIKISSVLLFVFILLIALNLMTCVNKIKKDLGIRKNTEEDFKKMEENHKKLRMLKKNLNIFNPFLIR